MKMSPMSFDSGIYCYVFIVNVASFVLMAVDKCFSQLQVSNLLPVHIFLKF